MTNIKMFSFVSLHIDLFARKNTEDNHLSNL